MIAVAGSGDAGDVALVLAEETGAALAEAGYVVATGGLGGIMEAASRGARSKLGTTLGILPGGDPQDANGWVELALPTGIGETRNALLVSAAQGLIAIGGGYGTLTEVAIALKQGKPVIGLGTWDVDGVEPAQTPAEAVTAMTARLG